MSRWILCRPVDEFPMFLNMDRATRILAPRGDPRFCSIWFDAENRVVLRMSPEALLKKIGTEYLDLIAEDTGPDIATRAAPAIHSPEW